MGLRADLTERVNLNEDFRKDRSHPGQLESPEGGGEDGRHRGHICDAEEARGPCTPSPEV